MSESGIETWDLREIIESLIEHCPEIKRVYLFGSRAYQTNSLRSDIDILAFTDGEMLKEAEINDWLPAEFPPVDLFWTYDGIVAKSVSNGSAIKFRNDSIRNYKNLSDQLDAILIWDRENGFNKDVPVMQKALMGVNFAMSIIPNQCNIKSTENIHQIIKQLEKQGIHTFFAGSTIPEITKTIIDMIETGLQRPHKFQQRAQSLSFDTISLCNEYDFQNFIHLLLRPVFKDIESEPVTVVIDGNSKKADFGVSRNQIIIEAKWIDTTSKKNEVLKTLDGLANFYKENPQIQSLIFLILYSKNVDVDEVILTERYTKKYSDPMVSIRFFKNIYQKI